MADRGDKQYKEQWFDFLAGVQDNRPKFMVDPRHASRMSGFYPYFGALWRMPHCKVEKNLGATFAGKQIQGLHEWLKPDGNWEMLIGVNGDIYTWDYEAGNAPVRQNVLAGRGEVTSIAAKVVTGEAPGGGADPTSFILELLQGTSDGLSNRWWGAPAVDVPDQFKLDEDVAESYWGDINYVDHHTRMTLVSDYTGRTGTALNAAWSVRKCFGTTARIFFEDIHDAVLIWSDAGTRPFKWDGTTFAELGQRTWQDFHASTPIQGPGTKWAPATQGSSSLTGKYKYRAVYVDADGNYSAPSDESAAVTVTNAASIRHNDFRDAKFWPIGTETVRFYRTKAIATGETNIAVVTLPEAQRFLDQSYYYRKDVGNWNPTGAGYNVRRRFSEAEKGILRGLIVQLNNGTALWDFNATVGYCNAIIGFAAATKKESAWRTFLGHLAEIIAGTTVIGASDLLSSYAFTVEFDTDADGVGVDWDDTVLDAGRDVSDTADAYESNLPPRHSVTSLVQFGGRLFYSVERSTTPTDALPFENYGETFAQGIQVSGRVADVSGTAGISEYHYGGTYVMSVGTDYQGVLAQFVLNGELFAVKENGIWRVDTPSSDPVDWGFVEVTNDANALNSSSVLTKGSAAFLLGRRNLKCRLWLFDGRRAVNIARGSLNIESGSLSSKWTSMLSWKEFLVINHSQAGHQGHLVTLISEKPPGGIFEWRWEDGCPMFSSPKNGHILGGGIDGDTYPQVMRFTEITIPNTLPPGMVGHYEIETPEADGGDPTLEKCWQHFWVELVNNKDDITLAVTAYFDESSVVVKSVYTLPNEGTKRFLQGFSLQNHRGRRVYFHLEFAGITAASAARLEVFSAGVRFVPLKTSGRPTT